MGKEKPSEATGFAKLRQPRKKFWEIKQNRIRMWTDWINGLTARQIAMKYNISQRMVEKALREMREDVRENDPAVADYHTMLVHGSLDVLAKMSAVMHSDPIPAYSNGKPIVLEDGTVALDYSGILAAADRVLKAHERLAKLTGVEAPTQNQITVTVQAQSAAEIAAQEAAARLAALREPKAVTAERDPEPDEIVVTVDAAEFMPDAL